VTYVLPFFRFLISPTGRNSEPIRTLDGSNDVFCLVHVPFGGLLLLLLLNRARSTNKTYTEYGATQRANKQEKVEQIKITKELSN
jgi:hypothetical protein